MLALVLWGVLAALFWDDLTRFFTWVLATLGAQQWLEGVDLHWLGTGLSALLHLVLLVPAVMFTALFITALFAVPVMVRQVAEERYPGLEKRQGGTFAGSLGNALIGTLGYLGLWLITLPLWLFVPPVVNFFAPVLSGLAFVHFLLEALFQERASGTPGLRA